MNPLDLAYLAGGIAGSPWLAYKAATDPRFRDRIGERMGHIPPGPPGIWFQAASVGEVKLVRPLVDRLNVPIRVTVNTRAGRDLAAHRFETVSYFPLDLTRFVRRALQIARPLGVVLVELEVWPNFLKEARVPVVVVNGRMTERSFRRYRGLRPLFRRAFEAITAAGVRGEDDAERFRALGVRDVVVTGNQKYYTGLAHDPAIEREWRSRLGWSGPVIVGGSTHAPEERLLLEAYLELRREIPDLRLALAPRHVERAPEVAKTVEGLGLGCYKRTDPVPSRDGVLLLDTVGELASLYSIATVAFVGGSFSSRGGQNILEPAALGKPVVTGPNVSNFAEEAQALANAGGLRIAPEPSALAEALRCALRDPAEMGERARRAVAGGERALEGGLELIRKHILRSA